MVPLAGLIDVEAERARLAKEVQKLAGKLSNEAFVSKAPAAETTGRSLSCDIGRPAATVSSLA